MVSVAGYLPGEMIAVIVLSYGLMLMVGIARVIRYMLNTEEYGKSSVWVPILVVIGGFIVLTLLYQYPVRIGTVMLVVGALFSWFVHEILNIFGRWSPFSFKMGTKTRFFDWIAGEKRAK